MCPTKLGAPRCGSGPNWCLEGPPPSPIAIGGPFPQAKALPSPPSPSLFPPPPLALFAMPDGAAQSGVGGGVLGCRVGGWRGGPSSGTWGQTHIWGHSKNPQKILRALSSKSSCVSYHFEEKVNRMGGGVPNWRGSYFFSGKVVLIVSQNLSGIFLVCASKKAEKERKDQSGHPRKNGNSPKKSGKSQKNRERPNNPKDPSALKIVRRPKPYYFTTAVVFTICTVFMPLFPRKAIISEHSP